MSVIDKFGRKLGADDNSGEPGPRGLPGPPGPGLLIDKDGNYSAQNHRVKSAKDPEDQQDAVTKSYVDSRVVERSEDGSFNFMSKKLRNVAAPTVNSDAATKGWVDERLGAIKAELRNDGETVAGGANETVNNKLQTLEREIAHLKTLLVTATTKTEAPKKAAPAGGVKKP